jgi:hypothetical protein
MVVAVTAACGGHGGGITGIVILAMFDPEHETTLFMAADNDFRPVTADVVNHLAGG